MGDQSYTTTISVDRDPQDVFDAINNVRGWWSEGIRGCTDEQGDVFYFEVPDVHRSTIEITELVPGRRVVWHILDNWMGYVSDQTEWRDTDIRFDITDNGDSTELRFTHVGLVPHWECFEACSDAWGMYVRDSLRSLITTGKGMPNSNPDEPLFQETARIQLETAAR